MRVDCISNPPSFELIIDNYAVGLVMLVDVIVPLPIEATFTYEAEEDVKMGHCVVVPFGKSKAMTGVVRRVGVERPNVREIKGVRETLDVRYKEEQVRLWEFVASYYCAPLGEVYRAAVPAWMISKDGAPDTYRQQTKREYYLDTRYLHIEERGRLIVELERAKKQKEAVERLFERFSGDGDEKESLRIGNDELEANVRRELEKRGVIVCRSRKVSRIDTESIATAEPFELTAKQQTAVEMIEGQFKAGKETVLLHGVTSSGKTEIYINLIMKCIEQGGQVLMLVPENGLTQHLYDRLKQFFGGRLGVYHTQCPQAERMETYMHQMSSKPYDVVLGTKSAVFLPFTRLRLVVVDEEHDINYKQTEQLPYYNARDVALYLAHSKGAKTVLGSATPSVESYGNHLNGKYGYVELMERYGGARLPQVQIVDMKVEQRKKHLNGHFSRLLVQQMQAALGSGHQVILFQDRNGYSPYVQCTRCGYVPKCPHCGVTLTYSKKRGELKCSYCGHTQPFVVTCAKCGTMSVEPKGLGVEQLEEETQALFPDAKVVRMTRETVTSVLRDFEAQRIDILIGTRSIIKGIDYSNVSVMGVMNVDNLLSYPDFRSSERAYQTMVQAAGRTGRRLTDGYLVVQTYMIDNPFLEQLKDANAFRFYQEQIDERQMFGYPPFSRIIHLSAKHCDLQWCEKAAEYIVKGARNIAGVDVSDIVEPRVGWAGGMYVRDVYVKITGDNGSIAKRDIMSRIAILRSTKGYERGVYVVNVDPA